MTERGCGVAFSHAVLRTGAGVRGGAEELAALLRSDVEVGPGERAMLANLVLGEYGRARGRSSAGPGKPARVEAVQSYRALKALHGEAAAAAQAAKTAGVSPSTLRGWDKELREREEVIVTFQNNR